MNPPVNPPTTPRPLVILGMFDLTRLKAAMAVRIHNLHLALQPLTPTLLLSGSRKTRSQAVRQFLRQGGLSQARAIYVEASTSAANPSDLWFLWQAHRAGIPIVIFIPDGYQLFPEIFPRVGLKVKLLDWGWQISLRLYQRTADCLLFPSQGLADCFPNRPFTALLPPGGLASRPQSPITWHPPTISYMGGTSYRYGSDLLLEAMAQVVTVYPEARCLFISHESSYLDSHPHRRAPWLTVTQADFTQLPEMMAQTSVTVIPLRQNRYNNLAVPVKLFDYISFGRPVVATAGQETAHWIERLGCGLLCQDNAQELAQGIIHLLQNRSQAEAMGQAGYNAVQNEHSWPHRAAALWQIITKLTL